MQYDIADYAKTFITFLYGYPQNLAMHPILVIIFCILFANIGMYIGKKLKIPYVVSVIITGIIIGLPFFKHNLFQSSLQMIHFLGNAGLLVLMFIAGLNSSRKKLKMEEKDSMIVTLFSTFVPFFLALLSFLAMGFSMMVALIIAVCISNTAEATNAEILLDLKKLKTKIGSVIMEAGLFDDVFGFFVFIMVTVVFHHNTIHDNLLLIAIITAFFMGIYTQEFRHYIHFHNLEKSFHYMLVPFFFISLGLMFDLESMMLNPSLFLIIFTVAMFGKIFGTLAAGPFLNFNFHQLHLIGWAMNSRGAVELALALIAFNSGMISSEIYSSLVMMALLTTVMFPFVVSKMIKINPKVMD